MTEQVGYSFESMKIKRHFARKGMFMTPEIESLAQQLIDLASFAPGWVKGDPISEELMAAWTNVANPANITAVIRAFQDELTAFKKQLASSEESNEALAQKIADCPHTVLVGAETGICGCSYDRPSDVCMFHAPALKKAREELKQARRDALQSAENEAHVLIGHISSEVPIDYDNGAEELGWNQACKDIATNIRALMEKPE